MTPLMYAVKDNRTSYLDRLIDLGSDVCARNNVGSRAKLITNFYANIFLLHFNHTASLSWCVSASRSQRRVDGNKLALSSVSYWGRRRKLWISPNTAMTVLIEYSSAKRVHGQNAFIWFIFCVCLHFPLQWIGLLVSGFVFLLLFCEYWFIFLRFFFSLWLCISINAKLLYNRRAVCESRHSVSR